MNIRNIVVTLILATLLIVAVWGGHLALISQTDYKRQPPTPTSAPTAVPTPLPTATIPPTNTPISSVDEEEAPSPEAEVPVSTPPISPTVSVTVTQTAEPAKADVEAAPAGEDTAQQIIIPSPDEEEGSRAEREVLTPTVQISPTVAVPTPPPQGDEGQAPEPNTLTPTNEEIEKIIYLRRLYGSRPIPGDSEEGSSASADEEAEKARDMRLLYGLPIPTTTVDEREAPSPKAKAPPPTPTPIPVPPARTQPAEIGINAGWVTTTWGAIPDESFYDLVQSTGAKWVRIEFMLRPWDNPASEARYDGRTWFQAYDAIVDGFTSRGIKVYALIGAACAGPTKIEVSISPNPEEEPSSDMPSTEVVGIFREYPGPYADIAEAWIKEYAENFVAIAEHFQGRIDTYELFNEPDDWDGKEGSVVHPCWFARMLEEIYLAAKTGGHLEAPFIHVSINNGPVEGLDVTTGAAYLRQTYRCGISQCRWREVKELTGSYPFDGIGYHIYVAQDPGQENEIPLRLERCLNGMWTTILAYEGSQTQKRIWISEIGWPSGPSKEYQARALTRSFDILRRDGRVESVFWFTLTDFNTPQYGHSSYGLYEIPEPRGASTPKPALDAFRKQTQEEEKEEDNKPLP